MPWEHHSQRKESITFKTCFPLLTSGFRPLMCCWLHDPDITQINMNKRNKTFVTTSHRIMWCLFLMTRAADHSWICCQLALTAGETFDEFVPANVHCANIAKGTQLHWHITCLSNTCILYPCCLLLSGTETSSTGRTLLYYLSTIN